MDTKEQNTFDIPSLIPHLPSSSKIGKENDKDAPSKSRQTSSKGLAKHSPAISKKGKRQPLGLRTPQASDSSKLRRPSSANNGVSRQKEFGLSPSPGPQTSSKKRAVLRYGETTESLFCLINESSQEHRRLCRGIVEESMGNDPAPWRRVLKLASQQKTNGTDLIRLHRRATLRFPVDQLQSENHADVLAIWLSFAHLHAKLGSVEEARRTYRHIENQRIQLGASFFLAVAEIERDYDKDRMGEALLRGIKENAEPVLELQGALAKLRAGKKPSRSTSVQPIILPSVDSRRSPRKRARDPDISPKRLKTENGFVERRLESEDSVQPTQLSGVDNESRSLPETGSSRRMSDASKPNFIRAKAEAKLTNPSLIKPTQLQKVSVSAAAKENTSRKPGGVTRQKLLSLRLSRKGLSGKAKRVDPEMSILDESESEPDSDFHTNTIKGSGGGGSIGPDRSTAKFDPPKFKKVDLSYMWEWDPSARGETTDTKQPSAAMEKIDEGSTSGQSTRVSQGTTPNTNDSSVSSISNNEKREAPSQSKNQLTLGASLGITSQDRNDTKSGKDGLLAKANLEFLPLVHEDNILRVSRIAYAKLGVIGKGGSCKVYRALSKKCSVVAIKKVKLEGMDKKAIEGYANEISLLKRLRGNPAIIQMYDSEVDLERKSIFVVMELGEVDLNHVLQQRAVSGTCRSLNLNFIRLTWQQMLSAVHCIHEERIIHSDLKPANFLFVRGALKLIDFGIAKAIQNDDTTNIYRESHIGTLNYMSPEAILDTGCGQNGPRMKIGRASDVWSLGCILYEMVYGQTPFAKLHFIQKLQAIVNPNHKILFPDEGDEAGIDAIKQCLRRNPEERPPIMGKNGLLSEHWFLHSSGQGRR